MEWAIGEVTEFVSYPDGWPPPGGFYPEAQPLKPKSRKKAKEPIPRMFAINKPKKGGSRDLWLVASATLIYCEST